jgi:hypothetical protein
MSQSEFAANLSLRPIRQDAYHFESEGGAQRQLEHEARSRDKLATLRAPKRRSLVLPMLGIVTAVLSAVGALGYFIGVW